MSEVTGEVSRIYDTEEFSWKTKIPERSTINLSTYSLLPGIDQMWSFMKIPLGVEIIFWDPNLLYFCFDQFMDTLKTTFSFSLYLSTIDH